MDIKYAIHVDGGCDIKVPVCQRDIPLATHFNNLGRIPSALKDILRQAVLSWAYWRSDLSYMEYSQILNQKSGFSIKIIKYNIKVTLKKEFSNPPPPLICPSVHQQTFRWVLMKVAIII